MTETQTESLTQPTTVGAPIIQLTERAVAKVKQFATSMPGAEGKPLRIYVQGGGCSGFQYGFTFDDRAEADTFLEQGGVQVVVDPQSLTYLRNATVDYIEDMRGAGFAVQNPNSTGGCGCGESFSV